MKRDAASDLPVLQGLVSSTQDTLKKSLQELSTLDEFDHFGFMVACFSAKQLEHSIASSLLQSSHMHMDASILARTMLEGTILLAWASLAPETRALRWRAFSLVSDYKQILREERGGLPVNKEYKKDIKARLAALEVSFLTSKARAKGEEAFPDPFQNTWCLNESGAKVELREMTEELNDKDLKVLYDDLSQAQHWTPRGVAGGIRRNESTITISFHSLMLACQVEATKLLSLSTTGRIFCEHFSLATLHEFAKLRNEVLPRSGLI